MKLQHYILAFAIASSMQLTDFKLGLVKVGDLFSVVLIFYYFLNIGRKHFYKPYIQLFKLFVFYFISSIIVMIWVKIYLPSSDLSILRQPGWISISRLIQLLGCVCFGLIIHDILVTNSKRFNDKFLKQIDQFVFLFFCFFILMYVLSFIGVDSPFVYGGGRLRGGYVEGGPFGLFVVFYFIVRNFLFGRNLKWLVLVIILIAATQSKASVLFFIVALILQQLYKQKISIPKVIGTLSVLLLFTVIINSYFDFVDRIEGYISDYNEIELQIAKRPDDANLIMGRIAATVIAPKMIEDNFLLGVGLGNYSLTRNNPNYLGVLPSVKEWDLTGLGGITNLLIETGVIGIFLFFRILYILYRKTKYKVLKYLILIFIIVQFFGVQTYFQYIWYLFGIITAIFYCKERYLEEPLTMNLTIK
ncbi:O-antigen ligase family protein [Leeuwenhoekiella polynyae]|uniref:O-antigen ligase-related domain-containing protein n=1 Tax=Leeuwenhoekiella polynyae TaxID=1550906 RepID=A0A4Q0NTW6_9FLAO|nr:O-antigen ligase family protein [Leeuwenhoekiella polynyae]RXG14686.1 hypothetical protein DSM02_3456 [Leeuwenhoekiella polynyae]